MKTYNNPWIFVPTAYFAEGLPYIIVNSLAVIIYKKMNIPNDILAFWTSLLYLPWAIKMIWSPFVDIYSTKRKWILSTQVLMAGFIALASFSLDSSSFLLWSMIIFSALAFLSATHDVAVDGFYMISMDDKEQAFFVGIRAFAYRLAMLFSSGVLVMWAGKLEASSGSVSYSWKVVLASAAFIMAMLSLYHRFSLPFPEKDLGSGAFDFSKYFSSIWSYFKQEKILLGILFLVFFRFGEAMLLKISAPFLLDPLEKGGIGLATEQYGFAYGTAGLICLISGNLIGAWLISKFGLKKCMWPLALALNVPDLVYVYMSYNLDLPKYFVYFLVAFEQFGYGLGTTAFMYYMIQMTDESNKTVHFAISTGIMAFAMMLPGMVSGKIQVAVGYPTFFVIVCLATIPGMLLIPFLKYKN
ncbi:MAG: AmpG family muropeptide MFS transporter [Elusimicrobia bacterium]|nr:AmpG family muropeptide MFS transporter [Elusimicrobiota bacterium]